MPDMTAAQLLAQQLCSPQCLLAAAPLRPAEHCDCACSGSWHGALGHVVVPDTAPFRQPAPVPQAGPALIDRSLAPVDLDRAHAELDELEQLATTN